MYIEYDIDENGDEIHRLTADGLLVVARWAAAALEQDNFDWDLICAEEPSPEALAERYRIIRWMHEMRLFDDLVLADPDEEYPDDIDFMGSWREDAGAVLMTFFIHSMQIGAAKEGLTPEEYVGRFKGHG